MKYHMSAFVLGFLLDLLLGDPYCLPHPIRLIGGLIAGLEKRLLGKEGLGNHEQEQKRGILLVFAVLAVTVAVSGLLLAVAYGLHPVLGVAVETVMT